MILGKNTTIFGGKIVQFWEKIVIFFFFCKIGKEYLLNWDFSAN